MKFEILINILFELLTKKTIKATELSKKYNISIRTVYRYVNTLDYAGVPVYATKGRNGGISIVDSFRLTSTFMTRNEFEQVIDTLTAVNSTLPNKTIESAILKLKSTIKNEYSSFSLKSGSLIIDASPWGDTDGYKSKINVVNRAFEHNRQLDIVYHDRNGVITRRTINPYIIVFKQGIWYVYAFCNLRKKFRFFKLGRIETANLLDSSFEKIDINKDEMNLEFWDSYKNLEEIVMEIDNHIVSDIEEWLGIENVYKCDNVYVARAKLPIDNGLISKIMSFGSKIKVIEPTKLKETIIKTANDILNNY